MLTIERGLMPALMKDYKKAAASGGQVSAAEDRRILQKGMRMIMEEYEGADSEKGLAAARNALATTRKSADKNWAFTDAADRVATEILGPGFDGKGGKMAALETRIRNHVRSPETTCLYC